MEESQRIQMPPQKQESGPVLALLVVALQQNVLLECNHKANPGPGNRTAKVICTQHLADSINGARTTKDMRPANAFVFFDRSYLKTGAVTAA